MKTKSKYLITSLLLLSLLTSCDFLLDLIAEHVAISDHSEIQLNRDPTRIAANCRYSPLGFKKCCNDETNTFFFIGYTSLMGEMIHASSMFKSSNAFQNPFVTTGDIEALHSTAVILLSLSMIKSISFPAEVR